MGAVKNLPRKLRLIRNSKVGSSPRWADLKAFGKRARSRRLHSGRRWNWHKGGRLKV